MFYKIIQRLGLSLVLFAALFGGSVLPVAAAAAPAASPSVTALDVMPGSMVRLQFANLPANVQFAVMMGVGGSRAVSAPTVAHVSSPDGGYVVAWVEILSDVSSSSMVDVRIDNGAGLSAVTSFVNTSSFAPPASPAAPAAAGTSPSTGTRGMTVLHVEKGGTVQVAISNLPANSVFTVTLGVAGSKGFGGFGAGTLSTGDLAGQSTISTFEIPTPLHDEATIDLRLESIDHVVYMVNFKNTDF